MGTFVRGAGSGPAALQEQAIGFLSHRGCRVAYAVTGSGPLLLLDPGRLHHLEVFWRHPPYRRLVQRLSRHFTVVRWDRPGFGLSDRGAVDLTPEAEVALLERVAGFLGADEMALVAADDAGPTAIHFAARNPGRIARLALLGTAAEGRMLRPALHESVMEALVSARAPAIHDVVAAAAASGCDPEVGAWLASAFEACADVATMAELIDRCGRDDARADLGRVGAPTLVLHREGDTVVEARWGRALADCIPGAEFVALPGSAHLAYTDEDELLLRALIAFLGEPGAEREPVALSQRELEVAHMVTLGLTNAEIGRRLTIRVRTVDAHLEHIRTKLGVRSRARIAAWAVHQHRASIAGVGAS